MANPGNGVGGGLSTRSGKALPFGGIKKPAEDAIVVVFQIMSEDITMQQALSNAITSAFSNFRFGDFGIVPVVLPQISKEKVTMSVTDTEKLAKFITPTVLRLLNMPQNLEKR